MKPKLLTGPPQLPDDLYFSGTLRLLLFPLSIVPIQFVEEHDQCRHEVQVLIHPACFKDAFRDVPLIGGSLFKYKHKFTCRSSMNVSMSNMVQ